MIKVLLISSNESFFYLPIKRALEFLNCQVVLGDYLDHPIISRKTLIHKTINKMPGFLKRVLINYGQNRIDNKILQIAEKIKPDLIFTNKAKYIRIDTLEKLRKIAITINWYPETMNNWNTIKKIVDHYDYFFEYDRYIVNLLKNKGHKNVYHLPFGADLDKNATWPDIKEHKNNVVFLGSYDPKLYPERQEFLDIIKDLGLKVWGNKAWLKTTLKNYYQGSLTPDAKLIDNLYKNSKIVIHSDLITKNVAGSGITLRPFDVTASGSLLLAHDDRGELFEYFKKDKEIISFHDGRDLREKVEYYLNHEDERIKIARSGFERVKKDHTYIDRIKKILDIINIKNENSSI